MDPISIAVAFVFGFLDNTRRDTAGRDEFRLHFLVANHFQCSDQTDAARMTDEGMIA